ncbi:YjbH domain-containing protein [Pseudoxanthomonas sp. SGNA-20]|uniref:YjbH domain-containing protein n=1 Tax=Pseudoxanthomonas sp. SGNA-20 TaxID=2493088 RepID=UPI000F63B71C|nr:YjbH domain-containing protein [Pseudoxanthomonas sp. SGNA-20]RRN53984.1 YjbH domain-containing protein [Pseudoxanthomonas sp. SGNA-20]
MSRNTLRHRALPALSLLSLAVCGGLRAEVPATQNDWGGIGLLQTPTARMAEEGEFAFTASHTSPYSRYNVAMQPFPWLEGIYRYVNVAGVPYGRPSLSGDQNYKDKSIDFKLRLWSEGRWMPELAFGVRDFGGTGFFSSEYLVASKRFGSVDASLGFATGYLGSQGNLTNPLNWIDDRFESRRPRGDGAGSFNAKSLLRGPVGIFGGVAWQTPWEDLTVKVEYDGHDYSMEHVRVGPLRQDSRINFGLNYTPSPGVRITLGWERGTEFTASLTLRGNLKSAPRQPRWMDTPKAPLRSESASIGPDAEPQPLYEASEVSTSTELKPYLLPGKTWERLDAELRHYAAFYVQKIEVTDQEVILHGNQLKYFYPTEGLGRAARVLDTAIDPSIDWVTLEYTRQNMPIAQSSVSRSALNAYVQGDIDLAEMARHVEVNPPGSSREGEVVYEGPKGRRFDYHVSPGLNEIIGGPNGFFLYQLTANLHTSLRVNDSTWLTATTAVDVHNNFRKFKYDAPSNLPRVRTDIRHYVTTSDVTIPNFQVTTVHALGRDLYGMAYAGLLEMMYGGVGGELLYRPVGQRWALGVEANWVKQRDFDQKFSFRDYEVATGHATLYTHFGDDGRVQVATSAGRYLAGDWGVTLDVSRMFRNGVVMGAFATKTDVSSAEFGEGSFDKGIYLSVPMDLLLPRSSQVRSRLMWHPLVRDGGARLQRKYSLYSLTGERDSHFYFDNIEYIDP